MFFVSKEGSSFGP